MEDRHRFLVIELVEHVTFFFTRNSFQSKSNNSHALFAIVTRFNSRAKNGSMDAMRVVLVEDT